MRAAVRAALLAVALRLMRAAVGAALLAAGLAPGLAQAAPGPRLWLGPTLALDPAFAAGTAGADWFFSARAAVGLCAAATLPGAGDRTAVESGYQFLSAVARARAALSGSLATELLAGAGLARIRFGSPGAHTELAPDLLLGAALSFPLPRHFELALELATHITFSASATTRNPAHTSELLTLAVRWGP
jgi:hypothetical protein